VRFRMSSRSVARGLQKNTERAGKPLGYGTPSLRGVAP
jgi:hypothetical protein